MKYRQTDRDGLAVAWAMGFISKGVSFTYYKTLNGVHHIQTYGEVPESNDPKEWKDASI